MKRRRRRPLRRKVGGVLFECLSAGSWMSVDGRLALVHMFAGTSEAQWELYETRLACNEVKSIPKDPDDTDFLCCNMICSSIDFGGRGLADDIRQNAHVASVRQLNIEALVDIGYDRETAKEATLPTLALHFGLVEHGYEIHIFEAGKYITGGCRDFSKDHKIEDLKTSLLVALSAAVDKWRRKL